MRPSEFVSPGDRNADFQSIQDKRTCVLTSLRVMKIITVPRMFYPGTFTMTLCCLFALTVFMFQQSHRFCSLGEYQRGARGIVVHSVIRHHVRMSSTHLNVLFSRKPSFCAPGC